MTPQPSSKHPQGPHPQDSSKLRAAAPHPSGVNDQPTLRPLGSDQGSSGATGLGAIRAPGSSADGSVGGSAGPRLEPQRLLGPYTLVQVLARGGMGVVWEAIDTRLSRRVALKLMPETASAQALARFHREAQNAAKLRHPNIVPIHDVGSEGSRHYLVMDLVHGTTLSEALYAGRLTYRQKAEVLEKMAGAVQYAHDQGVIHRDLKPSNVMMETRRGASRDALARGASSSQILAVAPELGEPLVMDFGLAKDIANSSDLSRTGEALGTPSYMPPEQAEGRHADVGPCSDVYSLGAILYEMLTGRPPFTGENVIRVLKAVVHDDPVAPHRLSRDVPRDLETICLTCLRKAPGHRYASALALAGDLRSWRAGEPISARRPSWFGLVARRLNRHRVVVAAALLAVVSVAAVAGLYFEKRKEVAGWDAPVVSEDFRDEGWRERWLPGSGGFERRHGRLVSVGRDESVLMFNRKLRGSTAIEYEAEMLPGSQPCDISLIWARDVELSADRRHVEKLIRPLKLQVGAHDGSCCAISDADQPLAFSRFHPRPGVRYRIRVEIVDCRISLAVDGTTVCQYTDAFPLTQGYVGLEAWYPDKAFGHMRIYAFGLPEKLPATAIGDVFAQRGMYAEAEGEYERVWTSYPGTALGQEALFKRGLCFYDDHDYADAQSSWSALGGSRYADAIEMRRIEHTFDVDQDYAAALRGMEALYRRADGEIRKSIVVQWSRQVLVLGRGGNLASLQAYSDLHDRLFPDDGSVDDTAAWCLLHCGRLEEVVRRYPHIRWICAAALTGLGRSEVVAHDYADEPFACANACFQIGEYGRLADFGDIGRSYAATVLLESGHADQVAQRFPADLDMCALAQCALGQLDQAIATSPQSYGGQCAMLHLGQYGRLTRADMLPAVLLAQHRYAELARAGTPAFRSWAQLCLDLEATIAGRDPQLMLQPRSGFDTGELPNDSIWLETGIIVPFIRGLRAAPTRCGEDWTAFATANRYHWTQRCWFAAQLVRGQISRAQFLEQPYRLFAEADADLLEGIRHDHRGERADAVASYRAFLARPSWQRGRLIDPFTQRFAEWRASVLDH